MTEMKYHTCLIFLNECILIMYQKIAILASGRVIRIDTTNKMCNIEIIQCILCSFFVGFFFFHFYDFLKFRTESEL